MSSKYRVRTVFAMVLVTTLFSPTAYGLDAPSKSGQATESVSISELTDGVWLHTSWQELSNGLRFPANGLIVRYKDELLLIDTAWGVEATVELLELIDVHLGMPVSRAIVTHFHVDSMGGTPALTVVGVPFFGSSLTRRLGESEGVPLPESLGELNVGDSVRMANVEVFYPGPGHTEDNLMVWVPHAKVLFGSCAVRTPDFSGRGNTVDADVTAWPVAIRRALTKYPDVSIVVPGHGNPGNASLLEHTISLFEE